MDKAVKIIKNSKEDLENLIKGIKLYNPIDFLREEIDIDVIG